MKKSLHGKTVKNMPTGTKNRYIYLFSMGTDYITRTISMVGIIKFEKRSYGKTRISTSGVDLH